MILDKKTILNYIAMFAIMLAVGMIPPVGTITPLGMQVFGIFAGTIYGLIKIDTIPVSLIGLVCLALTGYKPILSLLSLSFSNMTIVIILVSVIFSGAIAQTKCIDLVAKTMLTSKFAKKDSWNLVLVIFLLAAFGHICDMMFVTIFLLWNLVLKLADQCGYERKSMFVTYLIVMISVIAVSTGIMLPWRPFVLSQIIFWNPTMYETFPYAKHMLVVFVYLVVFIASLILIGKYVLRMNISDFKLSDDIIKEYEEMKVEPVQKFGLISLLLFAVIMLASSFLPSGSLLATLFGKFGLIGTTIVFLIAFTLFKDENGNRVMSFDEAHKLIPWSVIWLLLFIYSLCDAMQSADCGIITTITNFILPVFETGNIIIVMIIALIVISILTQIFNNVALAAVFMPILYTMCSEFGGNTYIFFILLMLVLNCDATTPAGSMSGAMCHGHAYVEKKYVYLFGLLASLLTIVICIAIVLPFGLLVC